MSRKQKWLLILAVMLPGASFAHHSSLGYDRDNVGEVSGVVVDLRWTNPHVLVDVKTAAGETWQIEFQGTRHMLERGLRMDDVEVGAQVTFAGYVGVRSTTQMYALNMLRPNCEEVIFYGSPRRWDDCDLAQLLAPPESMLPRDSQGDQSDPEAGLFRVWVQAGSHPLNRGNPDLYPMNDAGLSAYRAFVQAEASTLSGCTPKGMPTIMDNPFPYEFIESESIIEFLLEEYDVRRVIHMDRDSPPPGEAPSPQGYSVGRWVGETLEIETTLIDWPWINQAGMPQSPQSVIVERFTPVDSGSRLQYVMTITDPVYYSEPVTLEHTRVFNPQVELQSYDCQTRD